MAIPARQPWSGTRSTATYTFGTGWGRTPSTSSATANLPFVGPTQVIGVGFAPFTINVHGMSGSTIVSFSNLPSGQGASLAQALQQSGAPTLIRNDYSLVFVTSLQQSDAPQGVIFSVSPRTTDSSGVIATTSKLGSRKFRSFQAVVKYQQHITPAPQTVSGTVIGQLLLVSHRGVSKTTTPSNVANPIGPLS